MGDNATGSNLRATDTARNYRLYEKLPPRLREFLRNALHDYNLDGLLKQVRLQGEDAVINYMIRHDVEEARRDMPMLWGAQAEAYRAAQPPRRGIDYTDGGWRRHAHGKRKPAHA
jgi:hypothetical protein